MYTRVALNSGDSNSMAPVDRTAQSDVRANLIALKTRAIMPET